MVQPLQRASMGGGQIALCMSWGTELDGRAATGAVDTIVVHNAEFGWPSSNGLIPEFR